MWNLFDVFDKSDNKKDIDENLKTRDGKYRKSEGRVVRVQTLLQDRAFCGGAFRNQHISLQAW
jgi:hypothetical protein